MSRWFAERATVWLAPPRGGDAAASFDLELERRALAPRTRVTCILSGGLARSRVLPWNDALSSPAQRLALAGSAFVEAYGEAAREWAVREHTGRHGEPTLAVATPAGLADQLQARAAARGLRLVSLQPSLMYAYNERRRHLPAGPCWFVWEDGALTTLLLRSPKGPLHLKTLPTVAVEVGTLLDREWFLAGVDMPRCPAFVVRAGDSAMLQTAAGKSWQLVELPPIAAAASGWSPQQLKAA